MTEEPTYTFVKGQGWVPQAIESVTGVIGKWRVTIFNCEPDTGDYYVRKHPGDSISAVMHELIQPTYNYYFNQDRAEIISVRYGTRHEGLNCYKMELEKI